MAACSATSPDRSWNRPISSNARNSGCSPDVYTTPCANARGPLGFTACRPDPPPPGVVTITMGIPYEQFVYDSHGNLVPDRGIIPTYDIDGHPATQTSY